MSDTIKKHEAHKEKMLQQKLDKKARYEEHLKRLHTRKVPHNCLV